LLRCLEERILKLTKYNIEDAKEEQSKILKEVNSIKGNLDSIISNTKHINSALDDKM
jgi:flagellar biosynthesis chaperone FliJ